MANVFTALQIQAAYTQKVQEYFNKGMRICANTMSGHQGEIAKIDVTDGTKIYRIMLETATETVGQHFDWLDTVVLTVQSYDYDKRYDNRLCDSFLTLWNGKGEDVEKFTWYDLSGWKNRRKAFTDDKEKILADNEKRTQRYSAREDRRNDEREIKLTDEGREVLYRIVKEEKGYGKISRQKIVGLTKSDKYGVFYIKVEGKNDVRVSMGKRTR